MMDQSNSKGVPTVSVTVTVGLDQQPERCPDFSSGLGAGEVL